MRFLLAAALITFATNSHPNHRWDEVDRKAAEADFIFCETWHKFTVKHPEVMDGVALDGFRELCHSF